MERGGGGGGGEEREGEGRRERERERRTGGGGREGGIKKLKLAVGGNRGNLYSSPLLINTTFNIPQNGVFCLVSLTTQLALLCPVNWLKGLSLSTSIVVVAAASW